MNCLFESSSDEITGTKGIKKAIAIGGPRKPSPSGKNNSRTSRPFRGWITWIPGQASRASNSSDCVTAVDSFARKVTMAGGQVEVTRYGEVELVHQLKLVVRSIK